jgi:hypothetical protein
MPPSDQPVVAHCVPRLAERAIVVAKHVLLGELPPDIARDGHKSKVALGYGLPLPRHGYVKRIERLLGLPGQLLFR